MPYSIDTSTLIECWDEWYVPDVHITFWSKFDASIRSGLLRAPFIVHEELSRNCRPLADWLGDRDEFYLMPTRDLQEEQKRIVDNYPQLIDATKQRSMGDPWVIATARILNCPVITQETGGGDKKIKIPDVCRKLNMKCVRIHQFMRDEGWRI